MYFGDHTPPHFHATYGNDNAQIRIAGFGIEEGSRPPKAPALAIEWAAIHKPELEANWKSLSESGSGTFEKIEPLK